jgi:hypothetical protein
MAVGKHAAAMPRRQHPNTPMKALTLLALAVSSLALSNCACCKPKKAEACATGTCTKPCCAKKTM